MNYLPRPVRRFIYTYSGGAEAIAPARLSEIRAEEVSRWATGLYPARSFPAIAIGSSNGTLVHLCAALGIPWLPQTVLIPVRQSAFAPDEPHKAMQFGAAPAPALLKANPELQLHHMHDPNQDRLMAQRLAYFRVKRLRLGQACEQFIADRLPRGGTIILADCRLRWPTTRVGDRHFFQFGGFGDASATEYREGGERVRAFLERQKSAPRCWEPPHPDTDSPEAEWGVRAGARPGRRTACARARLSPPPARLRGARRSGSPVADLHRRWYAESGVPAHRLLVESFVLLDPWLAVRTGSVPFWTTFPIERSALALERYLDAADPYDEIRVALFAHGMSSIGAAPPDRWRRALARARRHGAFRHAARRFPGGFCGVRPLQPRAQGDPGPSSGTPRCRSPQWKRSSRSWLPVGGWPRPAERGNVNNCAG